MSNYIKSFSLSPGGRLMLISICAFSLMHLSVKALPGIPVVQIILIRSVFSLSICVADFLKNNIHPWGNNKRLLILRGLCGVLSLILFFTSIQRIPLASAITISNLMPLCALLLAVLFLNEKVSRARWLSVCVAFTGVFMIKGYDTRVSTEDLLIALGGTFFAGCAHFLVRKLKTSDHPSVIIFYFPLITIPIILPLAISQWVVPNPEQWLILICVAVFTHLGQWFMTRAYQIEEIGKVAHIYFLGIILALIYGYTFFNETFNALTIAGMLLIVGTIVFNAMVPGKRAT